MGSSISATYFFSLSFAASSSMESELLLLSLALLTRLITIWESFCKVGKIGKPASSYLCSRIEETIENAGFERFSSIGGEIFFCGLDEKLSSLVVEVWSPYMVACKLEMGKTGC